ncbi:MAG: hypothetical protein ACKVH0_19590 [Alphaproteobacteria bacterium]
MFKFAAPALLLLALMPNAQAATVAASDAVCGFLPYRALGPDQFSTPRAVTGKAKIGPQAAYPFAWDLARPTFLSAEVAEDLLAGKTTDAVREIHGTGLSLSEYMLQAANKFEVPPEPVATSDVRVVLAAERPANFHKIYMHSKEAFDAVVLMLEPSATDDKAGLQKIADAWRPAYAMVAKAQADDKRIELLSTNLETDGVAEKEAVACLAHAVVTAAGVSETAAEKAKAAAARWQNRPEVNARSLPKTARTEFFEYEDSGDAVAAAINALPSGPVSTDAFRTIAKSYATYVAAAKSLNTTMREGK